jgi:hypothetical protein
MAAPMIIYGQIPGKTRSDHYIPLMIIYAFMIIYASSVADAPSSAYLKPCAANCGPPVR